MKRLGLSIVLLVCIAFGAQAQQVMYQSLKALLEERGDTVTTLRVEKRTKRLMSLMGGADYRISVDENNGMSRYLKSRCYAVRVDSALYVNCRKMRYKRYRFGNWYAPAMQIGGKIYYSARPIGQLATSNTLPTPTTRLAGEIGDAIQAAPGLLDVRVIYELNPETGKSDFVGRDKMLELLDGHPALKAEFEKETGEEAAVIEKYLKRLK